jgi:hypothetical protein
MLVVVLAAPVMDTMPPCPKAAQAVTHTAVWTLPVQPQLSTPEVVVVDMMAIPGQVLATVEMAGQDQLEWDLDTTQQTMVVEVEVAGMLP